jgi:hypothetical protein
MSKKTKSKEQTLDDLVKAAHALGVTVTVGLDPIERMPRRFKDDLECVTFLVNESERLNAQGNRWVNAEKPNPIAADMCFRMGWALGLAAANLRCFYKGELTVKPKNKASQLIENVTKFVSHNANH